MWRIHGDIDVDAFLIATLYRGGWDGRLRDRQFSLRPGRENPDEDRPAGGYLHVYLQSGRSAAEPGLPHGGQLAQRHGGDSDTFTYDRAGRMLTALSGRYANTVTLAYDHAGRLPARG